MVEHFKVQTKGKLPETVSPFTIHSIDRDSRMAVPFSMRNNDSRNLLYIAKEIKFYKNKSMTKTIEHTEKGEQTNGKCVWICKG